MISSTVVAKRIGLCYKDKEWAKEQMGKFLYLLNPDIIEAQTDSKVCLKDGSYIVAFPCTDSARGRKLDKIYMQQGIDADYINAVLRPCILHSPALQMECIDDETGIRYFRGV